MSSASYQVSHNTPIWYNWLSPRPALKKKQPYSCLSWCQAHVFGTHETFEKYLLDKRIYNYKWGWDGTQVHSACKKTWPPKCVWTVIRYSPGLPPPRINNSQEPGIPGHSSWIQKFTDGEVTVLLAFRPSFPRLPPHRTKWGTCPFCEFVSTQPAQCPQITTFIERRGF